MAQIFRTDPKRLGEFLISAGVVSDEDIKKALDKKKDTGEMLGEVLVRLEMASERDIAEVISAQFSIPYIDMEQFDISQEAFAEVDVEMMEQHCIIPLDKMGNVLLVAMGEVLEQKVADEIENKIGCTLQVVVSTATAVRGAIQSQNARQQSRARGSAPPPEIEPVDSDVEVELLTAEADDMPDLAETEDAQIAREIEKQIAELGGDQAAAELESIEQQVEKQISEHSEDDEIARQIGAELAGMDTQTEADDGEKERPPEETDEKSDSGRIAAKRVKPDDDDFFDPSIIKPGG